MSNSIKTILIIILALSILGAFSVASAAINKQFNYQGKLTDDAGVAVADVAHNIKFVIYDAASGGNCLWTARGSCGSETARSITPSSGLFSVMLGDTAAGDNAISLNFDTDSYYLGITVESDAEMTPRKRIGAVPQAFNALNLIGSGYIDIDNTSTDQDALNINYNPASGAYGSASITYGSGGGTGIALTVIQSGNGNIVDFKNSSISIFTIASGGLATFAGVPAGAGIAQGSLYINPATATANYTLLGLAVGGAEKFRVDEDGDVAIEGDISFTGSQTISTTAGDLVLNPAVNLALSSNSITGLGTGITASGALTISTTGANNLTLTPGTGLTTTASTFQITGGLLDVDTYADIAYSGATTALTVTQSGTGAIADFTNTASATSGAFTLTNLGSGNSFLVEDSASADSTPFVIDADGNVGIGTTTPLSTLDVRGTIENGLVAWWSMDEGTGETTITDQSINSNTGTLGGGTAGYRPTWTNGKFGKGLSFDGDDDYVDCGDDNTLKITGAITLEGWVKWDDLSTSDQLFGKGLGLGGNGNYGYNVAYLGNDIFFDTYSSDTRSQCNTSSNPISGTEIWYHIVCTWDGTTDANGKKIYINGVLEKEATSTISEIGTPAYNFRIGTNGITFNDFNGSIDEVKIYNRALSSREISESYRQKAPSMAQGGTISDNSAYTALTVTQSGTGAAAEIGDATQNLTVYSDGRTIINYSNFEDISEGSAQSAFTVRPVGFAAVAYEDTGSYTDRTDEAKSTMGTAFTVAETGAGADIFYVGHTEKFYNLTFDLDTVSDGDVSALDMEFSAGGASWTAITSEIDGTAITESTLKQDGSIQWEDTDVSAWAMENINVASGDTTLLSYAATDYYWVRMKWTGTASPAVTAYIASLAMGTRMEIYAQSGDTTPTFYINDKGNVAIGTTSISSASSLTVDQIGTGKIVDFKNAGTSAFEVDQAIVKISQPLQINVAGDVGFSRSIEFTSTGASHIFSEGPFTIAAGDPNSAENLTLTTRTTEELAETGDVTTGAASYIVDTGQTSWVNDEFVGGRIEITAGPGIGEIREICANAASDDDRITACSNFTITPTTASDYSVYRKAGDILVNIGGTNITSGGFKVTGMDTNAIFRISPEGDVGIGTMSPAYALDIKSRSTVGTAFFVDGGGAAPDLDDITAGGTFIGATALNYRVKIDAEGTPDTFTWSDDGGSTWDAAGVSITGSAQDLNNGVTIIFAATTGHDLNDYWNFSTTVTNPFAIQNAAGTRSLSVGNDGNISVSAGVDNSTLLTIQNTDTAIGTAGYLLELIHDANDDADADFLICQDDGAGTPDTVFSIASDGTLVVGGSGTSTFNDSVSIGSGTANSADMGTGAAADLFITDDLEVDGSAYVGGSVTLSAYTRTIKIPATTARVGGTAPTATTIENTRGLGFDADAELAFIAVPIPSDWDGASDLTLITSFCGTSGDAIADGETIKLDISYNSVVATEAVDNGTEKTATATYTQSGAGTDKEMRLLSITIDYDNADQPVTAGDALFVKFNRDVTTDTYSGSAIVQAWALQYTSNTIPK